MPYLASTVLSHEISNDYNEKRKEDNKQFAEVLPSWYKERENYKREKTMDASTTHLIDKLPLTFIAHDKDLIVINFKISEGLPKGYVKSQNINIQQEKFPSRKIF